MAELHQLLIEAGLDVGVDAQDGIFGRDTLAAVLKYQSEHFGPDGKPLKPDGIVGDKTWWALQNPAAAPPADPAPPDQPVNGRTARAALEAALGELRRGVKEIPAGSNRGERIDLYTGFAGPGDRKGPAWALPPLPGDIFVIDRDGIHGHTGLIRAVESHDVWTIEGNSANAVRSIRRPLETIDTYIRIRP